MCCLADSGPSVMVVIVTMETAWTRKSLYRNFAVLFPVNTVQDCPDFCQLDISSLRAETLMKWEWRQKEDNRTLVRQPSVKSCLASTRKDLSSVPRIHVKKPRQPCPQNPGTGEVEKGNPWGSKPAQPNQSASSRAKVDGACGSALTYGRG